MEYWHSQDPKKPLFPDIAWSRPQQRAAAGKLLIVGGSTHGFSAVVKSYSAALATSAGAVKVAVPDGLKKSLPPDFLDRVFLPTNPSGALSQRGAEQLIAAADWADGILLVGDSGQNSETGALYHQLLTDTDRWATITRDAVDLLLPSAEELAGRPQTNLVMSFPQIQKLFSRVYYPKILTYSIQLNSLIEAVHKFTITYPVAITLLFAGKIIASHAGEVVTQDFSDQTALINGSLAAAEATYLLWNPTKPLEAVATSWSAI